jgi:PAS domain S-box-containing protein
MADREVQKAKQRWESTFNAMSDWISLIDTKTLQILHSNNIVEKFLGVSSEDVIGQTCCNIVHGLDESISGCPMRKMLHTKKRENLELRVPNTNQWLLVTVDPLKNEKGEIFRAVHVVQDITERKTIEAQLKRQAQIVDQIHDSVISVNLEGIITSYNKGSELLFLYPDHEIIGRHISILYPKRSHKLLKENIIPTLLDHGNHEIETPLLRKGGDEFIGMLSLSVFRDDTGETIGMIGYTLDITERKQFETQLQQIQKMESIGTLAGGIAHDFNNILFPILGYTEMLLKDIPEDSPTHDSLEKIYSGAIRAKDLVKQILTFSHQESGELMLMKMQPIIKEALKLIRSTIPTTIEIKQNIQADCGAIKADPTQIHQIIINLATNANHAMGKTGGEMKVNLKEVELKEPDLFDPDIKPGTYACLSIADTGKGMDNELIEKIFDPFFTTKEIGKGTGMGLSVVHGIVKNMNGVIKIHSEPDKGTQFHVYLPLAEAVKEQQVTKVVAASILGGTEHILLVDDEKDIIAMEQNMLERLGYKVTSRSSSLEALEAFRANPNKFDIIITDMAMPNMSGDKLSKEINKIRPGIPVLLCTGFSETMSEEKAISLGINGFLLKPIVMKDLSHKIREVLDKKQTGKLSY